MPLKWLYAFGFYLFQFSFSVNLLTFNLNILQHLPFMSCLLASLGLSSALSLHTCCPTCLFYLYFLFFFTEQLCSSLPLSASLPDYCCLVIFFPFLCQKPLGKSLSGSLWTLFLGCLIPSGLLQVLSRKVLFVLWEKEKRRFKRVQLFVLSSFPEWICVLLWGILVEWMSKKNERVVSCGWSGDLKEKICAL